MTRPLLSPRVGLTCTLALAITLFAACVSVEVAGGGAGFTQYVLADAGAAQGGAVQAQKLSTALLLQSDAGDPFADSQSIAYARREGERATYQLAGWTDRPSRRVIQLLQRRLVARASFDAVAALGQPLAADWLLVLAVDEIHHDVAVEPGAARLALRATLFDRRQRGQVAQRNFAAEVPTAQASSAAAAAAMNQALARVFDALVPWLEQEVERARRAGGS